MNAPRTHIDRIDSPLGQWLHAMRLPPPDLARDVAMIWFGAGSMTYSRDRILPRACAHLLINLGPRQFLVSDGAPVAFDDFWFSGTQDSYLDTEAPRGTQLLGVAFNPGGAWPYLPMPQHALRNFNGEVSALLGDQAMVLHRQLLDQPDLQQRLDRVEAWLRAQRQARHAQHSAVAATLHALDVGQGQPRVGDLARASGISERRLSSLFEREVGCGPKAYARLKRFHACLGLLRQSTRIPWAEMAVALGYADQAHMSRDIKAYSGYAPSELLARPAPDAMTVVVQ